MAFSLCTDCERIFFSAERDREWWSHSAPLQIARIYSACDPTKTEESTPNSRAHAPHRIRSWPSPAKTKKGNGLESQTPIRATRSIQNGRHCLRRQTQVHFLCTMEGPLSSYSSFLIHISSNVDSEDRMAPPIQTEYFLSGGAMILMVI